MTEDDVFDVMRYVDGVWKNQPMTKDELEAWRRQLRGYQMDEIVETIDEYPPQIWRPGIQELREFHHARVKRIREAKVASDPRAPYEPPTDEQRALAHREIDRARELLGARGGR